jgi:hypothetical protein
MLGGKIAELGRHVTLVVLGEDRIGDEGAVLEPASATAPLPSRKRSGTMPR